MSESSQQASDILRRFYTTLDDARRASVVRALLRRDEAHSHIIFNCNLSAVPTQQELRNCFGQRDDHYSSIAPTRLRFRTRHGAKYSVPVTPLYASDVDYHTYNTITIRRKDGATVVVLVRCADNYVCGVMVYKDENEKANAKWMLFKDVVLPSSFKPIDVVMTKYSFGHDTGEDYEIGRSSFSELIDFLLTLRDNPEQQTTETGKALLGALFVVFGEAQRFKSLRRWVQHNVTSRVKKCVPKKMSLLYQKWSNICKVCYIWYIYLLDASLPEDCMFKSERTAMLLWDRSEKLLGDCTVLNYRNSENKYSLECLVGEELLLLKHDLELCTAIIMRELGYQGPMKKLDLPYGGVAEVRGVRPFSDVMPAGAADEAVGANPADANVVPAGAEGEGEALGANAAGAHASCSASSGEATCSDASSLGPQLSLFASKLAAAGFPVAESGRANASCSSASALLTQQSLSSNTSIVYAALDAGGLQDAKVLCDHVTAALSAKGEDPELFFAIAAKAAAYAVSEDQASGVLDGAVVEAFVSVLAAGLHTEVHEDAEGADGAVQADVGDEAVAANAEVGEPAGGAEDMAGADAEEAGAQAIFPSDVSGCSSYEEEVEAGYGEVVPSDFDYDDDDDDDDEDEYGDD